MNLTSFRRYRYMMADSGGPLGNDVQNRRRFINLIASVSMDFENYLDRKLELTSRTEYFQVREKQVEFFVKATPIDSITSLKYDSLGLYDGNESTLDTDNYHINADLNGVETTFTVTTGYKGLQLVYTGGLATHATQSQFTLSSKGSTEIAAGKYVYGASSEAVGYCISNDGTTMVVEVLYGVFTSGEVAWARAEDGGVNQTNAYATITRTVTSLAESQYMNIVTACEMQVRYMESHKSDMENQSTGKQGTNRKDMGDDYDFLPEVRATLDKYRIISL